LAHVAVGVMVVAPRRYTHRVRPSARFIASGCSEDGVIEPGSPVLCNCHVARRRSTSVWFWQK